MFAWLRVGGFETLVNKDFLKENEVLTQHRKLKIQSSISERHYIFQMANGEASHVNIVLDG